MLLVDRRLGLFYNQSRTVKFCLKNESFGLILIRHEINKPAPGVNSKRFFVAMPTGCDSDKVNCT